MRDMQAALDNAHHQLNLLDHDNSILREQLRILKGGPRAGCVEAAAAGSALRRQHPSRLSRNKLCATEFTKSLQWDEMNLTGTCIAVGFRLLLPHDAVSCGPTQTNAPLLPTPVHPAAAGDSVAPGLHDLTAAMEGGYSTYVQQDLDELEAYGHGEYNGELHGGLGAVCSPRGSRRLSEGLAGLGVGVGGAAAAEGGGQSGQAAAAAAAEAEAAAAPCDTA